MTFRWFVPTFHGDIAVERDGDNTIVKVEKLVPSEIAALTKLRHKAIAEDWVAEAAAFPEPTPTLEASIPLKAKLEDVILLLTGVLKPTRKQLSVVRFSDGSMEEVTKSNITHAVEKGKAATTVATPTQGCPLPDFERQEIRATRVLSQFLEPEQLEDFLRTQAFVSRGVDTGHRYLLISRHASRESASFRSVFDLEEQQAYCIHDWTVPAAEELLSLHLHLQIPGMEVYMRGVPADGQIH